MAKPCTVHAHGRTHQPGGACFTVAYFVLSAYIYLYILTEGCMLFVSVSVKYRFPVKAAELTEL